MTLVAALAAALAVLVAWPGPRWCVWVRLGGAWRPPHRLVCLALASGAVGVAVACLPPAPLVLAGAGGVVLAVVGGQVRASAARRARRAGRADTAEFVDVLAGYLRAGLLPTDALVAAAADHPGLADLAGAARHGDLPAALRTAAVRPGREALGDVAAAWLVADRAGAPLAVVLERVATGTRDSVEAMAELDAAVAPARATGLLMGALPGLGFSLGAGMGADPVGVITINPIAAASVCGGALLAAAGVVWIDRLALRAEGAA